jgi:hypothetical protein
MNHYVNSHDILHVVFNNNSSMNRTMCDNHAGTSAVTSHHCKPTVVYFSLSTSEANTDKNILNL